eukprot:3498394-Rhodomonas_salina.2
MRIRRHGKAGNKPVELTTCCCPSHSRPITRASTIWAHTSMIRSAPFAAHNSNYAMQQRAIFPLQMQMQMMRKPMLLSEFQIQSLTLTTPSVNNIFGLQLSIEDSPMLSLDKENDYVNIMSCSNFQIQ